MDDNRAQMSGPPHVLLMLLQDLPATFESDVRTRLDQPGLDLVVMRRANEPFAGLELYLPTAVALFITFGFFNGFLQEAGKDSYEALKSAAKALWRRAKGLNVVAFGTAGKVSAVPRYSLTYSITGEVAPRLNFKLLFQTEIDASEAEAGIIAFFDMIDDLFSDRLEEADLEALLTYRPVGGTVLVTYDAANRLIVPVNAREDRH